MAGIIGSGLELYLHQQAREKGLNRLAEARKEAQRISEEAATQIEARRREVEMQTARLIEEKRRRAVAQARLRAKRTIIQRQDELIQQVWQQAEAALKAQTDECQRLATLGRLLADAAIQLGGGPLQVQANAADRALLESKALDQLMRHIQTNCSVTSLALAENPASILGGVIVRRLDTNEIVDNSFDERLALTRRMLRDEVYRLLNSTE